MSPRGRRPGGGDTRGEIVAAARAEFAERGYDATSLRAIARRAGVDPALVHHYFDGKPALFAEVMTVPISPHVLVESILQVPREQVGQALATAFFTLWDAPEAQERLLVVVRGAVTNAPMARTLREFLAHEIFGRIIGRFGPPDLSQAEIGIRSGAAAGQLIGVALLRYVLRFPALADAPAEEIVALVGPTLQRYLTAPADQSEASS